VQYPKFRMGFSLRGLR